MAISGFGEVAERLLRSTVLVQAGGSGSGVIWSTDGIIVTNAHVARGSQVGVQLWDGRELEAKIMSRNLRRDIALLCVNANDLSRALRGRGPRVQRLEFLREDYLHVRRVSVQLGGQFVSGRSIAA